MITQSFALAANTPLLAKAGRLIIREIKYTSTAAAGIFTAYDQGNTTLTQSNPAYSRNVRTTPYSRSVYARVINDDTNQEYTRSGASDNASTVALNATYPIPPITTLQTAAAGTVTDDNTLTTSRGLVLNSTVAGVAIVTYEAAA